MTDIAISDLKDYRYIGRTYVIPGNGFFSYFIYFFGQLGPLKVGPIARYIRILLEGLSRERIEHRLGVHTEIYPN